MLLRRMPLSTTLVVLLAVLAGLLVGAPRADATSSLLCKGFKSCRAAGYLNFGYAANYRSMWWRMFAGHNCTNYAAYRMVRNGMSSTRPWSGSGDARNWGKVFASKTNQTPMVGSVAWWSTNHVAYVQQVIDANTIVISEDHWGGDFDWRKIVRSGGGWPTGFIHLTDETLAAKVLPAVIGAPKVDAPLSVSPGTWNIAGATYAYQWYANGGPIAGATAATYVPSAAQVAAKISVRVTASRSGYRSGVSVSAVSAPVAPGTMRTTAAPTVTGLAKVGGVLTVAGGAWEPAPSTTSIAWYADGTAIPGATAANLRLGPDQLNHRITAVLTARRAGYTDAIATTAPTAPVAPEKLAMTSEPTLAGVPHLRQELAVTPGVVSPGDVTVTYRWMRDGARIKGAHQLAYTPTADDLGARLSVRVAYTKAGYTPIVKVLSLPKRVHTVPAITVRSREHRSLTVSLSAPGLPNVGGTVTIINARGDRRTRHLVHGEVSLSPYWLHAGSRTFTVIFSGSRRVDARTIVRTLVVK